MSFHLLRCYAHKWTTWIGLVPLSFALAARAQTPTCPAVAEHDPTPAETAYLEGRFAAAQDLYEQALAKNPQDINLNAAMVRTLLRENRALRRHYSAQPKPCRESACRAAPDRPG